MTSTVLLVEDDMALRRSITQSITLENLDVIVASSYSIAVEHIVKNFNGVVLTDIRLEGKDGFEILKYAQSCDTELPVVMLTGHGDIAMAVRAIQKGAYDFLEKPCHPDHLLRVLKKALNHRRLVMRLRELEQQAKNNDPTVQQFPGTSPAINNFRSELHKFSELPVNVHLYGEFGSGRHAAAKCIYTLSRSNKALFEKNLADCNSALFESMENGDQYGFWIFKNIELASTSIQERLSEFMDEHTDLRIITTSSAALQEIPEEQLIKSLLYKLSVVQIEVPTLRTRPEDLLPTFYSILQQQSIVMALPIPELSADQLSIITTRDWNGNVEELRQHARKVVLKLDGHGGDSQKQSLANRMRNHEKSILEDALKRHKGHTANVAEELSIPVKTLYDRLARHGLKGSKYR
ncbi:MAG: response regulator [Gammaproteobacteria bacterium]|nr:response regulator [Gammaproteobacteria bacterium]